MSSPPQAQPRQRRARGAWAIVKTPSAKQCSTILLAHLHADDDMPPDYQHDHNQAAIDVMQQANEVRRQLGLSTDESDERVLEVLRSMHIALSIEVTHRTAAEIKFRNYEANERFWIARYNEAKAELDARALAELANIKEAPDTELRVEAALAVLAVMEDTASHEGQHSNMNEAVRALRDALHVTANPPCQPTVN